MATKKHIWANGDMSTYLFSINGLVSIRIRMILMSFAITSFVSEIVLQRMEDIAIPQINPTFRISWFWWCLRNQQTKHNVINNIFSGIQCPSLDVLVLRTPEVKLMYEHSGRLLKHAKSWITIAIVLASIKEAASKHYITSRILLLLILLLFSKRLKTYMSFNV